MTLHSPLMAVGAGKTQVVGGQGPNLLQFKSTSNFTTPMDMSFDNSVGAGNFLLAGWLNRRMDGRSMTASGGINGVWAEHFNLDLGNTASMTVWYGPDAIGGATTITLTRSGNVGLPTVFIAELEAAAVRGAVDNNVEVGGTTSYAAAAGRTEAAGATTFAFYRNRAEDPYGAITWTPGFTQDANQLRDFEGWQYTRDPITNERAQIDHANLTGNLTGIMFAYETA